MIQTLDVEFSKYCQEELLIPATKSNIKTWEVCRRKCADLCIKRGLIGMARELMKDEDGLVDNEWWESHKNDKFCGSY